MADRPGIALTRVFDAPRERVWQEWTTPASFADWFGGTGSEVPLDSVDMDVRAGGSWRLTMFAGTNRNEIHWHGEYREVDEPARLVFTLADRPGPERELVTVELRELGDGRTEMRFEQRGEMTEDQYRAASTGWGGFFDRIARRLSAG